jgi:O-antigen/teichoic acid export membrane protein
VFGYYIYRLNAIRIYPDLRIHPSLFRTSRLREVTGFSIYASIIDWANKLNYELDEVVIGIFFGSAYVVVWAVAERIISGTQRLTNQLNGVLFPVIVDSDTSQQQEKLQRILLQGTLLSLAMVVPISAALILLADPLVRAWVGPEMIASVPVIQILAVAVAIRVGNATATTLLKGAGQHRMLAWINLSTGVVNILLSVALIKPFGLTGVAVGTLIPIALSSILIVQPAACRRVGLPVRRARFWLWHCRRLQPACCISRCSSRWRSAGENARITSPKSWSCRGGGRCRLPHKTANGRARPLEH